MLFYLSVLLCSAATVSGGGPPARKLNVPLTYTTIENFVLTSESQHTFKAEMSCSSAKSGTISVCAELPNNWDWQDFKGYVYMNVFNTNVTTNLSAAIASTGKPHSGKLAVQCTSITNWPGGDMYIRVDANAFTHVAYTLTVKLLTSTTIQKPHHSYELARDARKMKPLDQPDISDDSTTTLTRVIIVDELVDLEYNTGVLLEIDLCLPPQTGSNLRITTTVLADTGIYTHFICKDTNCSPDSLSVIGRQVSPLPSGYASAGINHLSKVYVSVYNLGGEKDGTTNKVMGQFRFGANLYTGSH